MHKLDAVIEPLHLLKHSFYQRWMNGDLTKEDLKHYAKNYFPHVLAFPTYVSAVHSRCADLGIRQALLENLIEEERGEKNHPELWLRFSDAIGASREELKKTDVIPEAQELVNTFQLLTQKSFASGIGALYAYESQIPSIAAKKIEGLQKHFGMKNPKDYEFFTVHLKADEFHSETERNAFDEFSASGKNEAVASAKEACQSLWNFLSGVERR